MKENKLEKQVEYKLSDVVTIFSNMIIENGIDNLLDDMDYCIYTTDFVEELQAICYVIWTIIPMLMIMIRKYIRISL